jgi:hypothetical protein
MENKEPKNWPENITYWNKITEKTAELVLKQTETLLTETLSTAQSIRDKADKLTALLIPLISALTIYVLSGLNKWNDILHLTAIISLLVLITSLGFLYLNLIAYTIRTPGSDPETLINNYLINKEDTAKEQFIQIALQLCIDYKFRMEKNNQANSIRSNRNQTALKIIVIGLTAAPVLAFIVHLFWEYYFSLVPCR